MADHLYPNRFLRQSYEFSRSFIMLVIMAITKQLRNFRNRSIF